MAVSGLAGFVTITGTRLPGRSVSSTCDHRGSAQFGEVVHQGRIEKARSRLVAELDPGVFAEAIERGEAMSFDEIVSYALEQLAALAER